MPFQPINFAGIAPQGYDALANLSAYLKGGMELGEQPAKFTSEQALREAQQNQALGAGAKSRADAQKAQVIADILTNYQNRLKNKSSSQQVQDGQPVGDQIPDDDLGQLMFNKIVLGEAETPSMKARRDVATEREKKKAIEDLPTQKTLSANQQASQAIDILVPQIEKLKTSDRPGQMVGKYIHPSRQKVYEDRVRTIYDALLSALNLNPTDKIAKDMKDRLTQSPTMTDADYEESLNNLVAELRDRQDVYDKYSRPGARNSANKQYPTKTIGGVTYFKRGDKWYQK